MSEIRNIDAIEYVKSLDDDSMDLIVLDPNYQDWDDFVSKGLIEESIRVCKETGNILCFTKQPFDYNLRIAVNPFFRREIVWTFENGGAWVSKKMPLVSTQKIYWLVKSKEFYFNPRTGLDYSENTKDFKRTNKVWEGFVEEGQQFEKSSEGVWLRDHLHYNKPQCGSIPQKPRELIQVFLRCFAPQYGNILDLFGGSGVVSDIADDMGDEYFTTEIDQDRYQSICDLLGNKTMSLFKFGLKEEK